MDPSYSTIYRQLEDLNRSLTVWDESLPVRPSDQLGWADNKFYLQGRCIVDTALYLPISLSSSIKIVSHIWNQQSVVNIPMQIESLKNSSEECFKSLSKFVNHQFPETEIRELTKMLLQLRKTIETFNFGISIISTVEESQKTVLKDQSLKLFSSINSDISKISNEILNNCAKVSFGHKHLLIGNEFKVFAKNVPYSRCDDLQIHNKTPRSIKWDFLDQLNQVNNELIPLDFLPLELTGDSKADMKTFSRLVNYNGGLLSPLPHNALTIRDSFAVKYMTDLIADDRYRCDFEKLISNRGSGRNLIDRCHGIINSFCDRVSNDVANKKVDDILGLKAKLIAHIKALRFIDPNFTSNNYNYLLSVSGNLVELYDKKLKFAMVAPGYKLEVVLPYNRKLMTYKITSLEEMTERFIEILNGNSINIEFNSKSDLLEAEKLLQDTSLPERKPKSENESSQKPEITPKKKFANTPKKESENKLDEDCIIS